MIKYGWLQIILILICITCLMIQFKFFGFNLRPVIRLSTPCAPYVKKEQPKFMYDCMTKNMDHYKCNMARHELYCITDSMEVNR